MLLILSISLSLLSCVGSSVETHTWDNCPTFSWLPITEVSCPSFKNDALLSFQPHNSTKIPTCLGKCLQYYTPCEVNDYLDRVKEQLGYKPQLIFIGESIMRGWVNLMLRFLEGHFVYDFSARHREQRQTTWMWEGRNYVVHFYFIGGYYSSNDSAKKYAPILSQYSTIEQFLTDLLYSRDNLSSSFVHNINKALIVTIGAGIWDMMLLSSTETRINLTEMHFQNIVDIVSDFEKRNEYRQMKFLIRDLPAVRVIKTRQIGLEDLNGLEQLNSIITNEANSRNLDVFPAFNISIHNKYATTDGVHYHCENEDHCNNEPRFAEVPWAWTQYFFYKLMTFYQL